MLHRSNNSFVDQMLVATFWAAMSCSAGVSAFFLPAEACQGQSPGAAAPQAVCRQCLTPRELLVRLGRPKSNNSGCPSWPICQRAMIPAPGEPDRGQHILMYTIDGGASRGRSRPWVRAVDHGTGRLTSALRSAICGTGWRHTRPKRSIPN